jgi:hypothetical protein
MQKIPYVESGTYLFRFFNHRAEHFWPAVEDILSHQTLFLNSRVNFNDPYDSQPVIVDDLSNRAIRQNLSEALRNPLPPKRSWQAVARALDMNSNGKTSFKKTEIENIKIALRKNAEQHLDSAGLLSFSLTAENPLLWGHYAASFGGVCAVFRRGHSLRSCLALCAKVSYVDKRPQLSLSLIRQMSRRWMSTSHTTNLQMKYFSSHSCIKASIGITSKKRGFFARRAHSKSLSSNQANL